MIMLGTAFWIMVVFFAIIGTQRTWTREIIATAGLVLSLFIIYWFIPIINGFIGFYNQPFGVEMEDIWTFSVIIMGSIHLFIAFAAYAGPALSGAMGARLKVRDNIQDKFMALLAGGLNGYLIVGTLWGILNYYSTQDKQWLATTGVPYPFAPYIVRPPDNTWDILMEWLPIPLVVSNEYILRVLVALVLLFVLIVLI